MALVAPWKFGVRNPVGLVGSCGVADRTRSLELVEIAVIAPSPLPSQAREQTNAWSARLDRGTENVCIHAIVVSELELSDVERKIRFADLVERTHHAALDDRPEAFNRVCMDRASNIFVAAVVDDAERVFTPKG